MTSQQPNQHARAADDNEAPRPLMPGDATYMGPFRTMADAPPRMDPDEVAADPFLPHVAEFLANCYLLEWNLAQVLDGADHTYHPVREFVADLIDAHHTRLWRRRWTELHAGADPDESDENEPWLIDRPWRQPPPQRHPYANPTHTRAIRWEVWRTHLYTDVHGRAIADACALQATTHDAAVRFLFECQSDEKVAHLFEFYLVQVTVTRARVTPPQSEPESEPGARP